MLSNPPPPTLTAPDISADNLADGINTFLTVVEIFRSCPVCHDSLSERQDVDILLQGHVVEELGVTSVEVDYSIA